VTRRRSRGRSLDGIFLLDKPLRLTSNTALQKVKRLFDADKAGHTGNLDPLATGMLPICFGEATKISAYLLDADKVYEGRCKLGVRTTTADGEGEVIATAPLPELELATVDRQLDTFRGTIEQIPPMHSALKVNGQPLYKLAHQGREIERQPRSVTIYSLEILRLDGDELDLRVHCSKGTYIRTLAEDIGQMLGCGAHLSALRRTRVGPFRAENMVTLDQLEALASEGLAAMDRHLLPIEAALADWPELQLTSTTLFYLRQGQPVMIPRAPTSGWIRLLAEDGRFIGIGSVLDDGRVAPKRLVQTGR
jgi:tRNA pseudouridine55 synthase